MKFGLLWPLRNPPPMRRPLADIYQDTLEEIAYAESLGYESAWLTEHRFSDDDYLPSVMPALAAVAARTTRIRLGPYVLLMPFHHPIRLAEDAAVVDVISNGRLDLAMGVGYRKEEFEAFGISRRTRGRHQDEGTQIMLKAWAKGAFDHEGELFSLRSVNVTPKPVQRPIPIYLGGTSRPVLERVARLGVTGVAGRPEPEDMEFLVDQLGKHGRRLDEIDFLPFRFLWVDRDHARARRVATPFAEWVIGHYQRWFAEAGTPMFEGDPARYCIMGSPDYCIEKLEAFIAAGSYAPSRQLVLQPPLLGLDHAESMRMIETFASEVMPYFAD